jgi:ribosomal protein L24
MFRVHDEVLIISGENKNKTGTILDVWREARDGSTMATVVVGKTKFWLALHLLRPVIKGETIEDDC